MKEKRKEKKIFKGRTMLNEHLEIFYDVGEIGGGI